MIREDCWTAKTMRLILAQLSSD